MAEETKLKVLTKVLDYPISTLREMCDDGDLDTQPDYQRGEVYDDKKKSRLIESLILDIPIPNIYLCEEEDGTYSVIDGQQRITSFVKFLKNEYKLSGLTEMPEYNGKFFKDLDRPIQKQIKTSPIHAVCLLKESQALKYEIFARLNQGAVKLKEQELRNCVYRGTFNNMLKDIASNNKYISELFVAENSRMNYEELILRFFSLRNYLEYKSSMVKTLNEYMSEHQNDDATKIEKQKKLFEGTLDIVKQVLGKEAFYTYDYTTKMYKEKLSKTAFDSIMIAFSYFDKSALMRHADDIRVAIADIRENSSDYRDYIESSSSSKNSVQGRIKLIYDTINTFMDESDKTTKRIFDADIKKLLFKAGYVCSYCNNTILSIDDAEIDHIIPYSKGGKTEIENAQLLHRHCNREKNNTLEDEWAIEEDE